MALRRLLSGWLIAMAALARSVAQALERASEDRSASTLDPVMAALAERYPGAPAHWLAHVAERTSQLAEAGEAPLSLTSDPAAWRRDPGLISGRASSRARRMNQTLIPTRARRRPRSAITSRGFLKPSFGRRCGSRGPWRLARNARGGRRPQAPPGRSRRRRASSNARPSPLPRACPRPPTPRPPSGGRSPGCSRPCAPDLAPRTAESRIPSGRRPRRRPPGQRRTPSRARRSPASSRRGRLSGCARHRSLSRPTSRGFAVSPPDDRWPALPPTTFAPPHGVEAPSPRWDVLAREQEEGRWSV
jgi:hypothetical protein